MDRAGSGGRTLLGRKFGLLGELSGGRVAAAEEQERVSAAAPPAPAPQDPPVFVVWLSALPAPGSCVN